jgi:FRG domain
LHTDFPKLWTDFWAWMEQHPAGLFLFRGQADRSPIIPKIGRPAFKYHPARETQLHEAFKRAARSFVQTPLSEWEWLALAQHHGAPTRLADWSTSPLVAAWFAVASYPETTDAAIFGLDVNKVDHLEIATGIVTRSGASFANPFAIKDGVYLIETAPVSARITTQRGIFTVHGSPTSELVIPAPDTFAIRNEFRADFQGRLLDLGIDASHIYPDLDGLCRTLEWKLKSGRGFSLIA